MTKASRLRISAIASALAFGAQGAAAQNVLLQPRPNEVGLAPIPLKPVVSEIELSILVYPFFLVRPIDDKLRIDVRALADLSDLQSKIGKLVDTIRLQIEGLRITDKEITIDGNVATLTLKGDVSKHIPPLTITQPFFATLPFTLQVAGPHTVALKALGPTVDLDGPFGDLLGQLLRFLDIDINGGLKETWDHAISPDLLKASIPEDLLWLNPVITRAEFLSNSGNLAASLEANAALDGGALIEFIKIATAHPDDDQ